MFHFLIYVSETNLSCFSIHVSRFVSLRRSWERDDAPRKGWKVVKECCEKAGMNFSSGLHNVIHHGRWFLHFMYCLISVQISMLFCSSFTAHSPQPRNLIFGITSVNFDKVKMVFFVLWNEFFYWVKSHFLNFSIIEQVIVGNS